jgi:hypothetical protein
MTTFARRSAVLAALFALGCGSDLDDYQKPEEILQPVALDHSVAYIERSSATAFVLDPADPALAPRLAAVGKNPVLAVRRSGQDELLVLAQGQRGEAGVTPEDASLTLVPSAGQTARRINLGARFDGFSQSDDGRFAVLRFASNQSQGEVLFNPNEIAVVDLAAAVPAAVGRTLRSFGGVPLAVTFSPALTLPAEGGRSLRLGVALSDGYVTLFDLEHGERTEITVSLTLPDDHRMLRPVQVLFEQLDPTRDPTLFVRAEGSNDLFALSLASVPAAERTPQGNDFRPVLSLLGVGAPVADMQVFAGPDGSARLLVLAPGRQQALVIDPTTSRTTPLALGMPATRIVLFAAPAPGQPDARPRALLVPMQGPAELGFLDLDQVEDLRSRNLDTRTMGAAADDLVASIDHGVVIVEHANRAGLSVIDLAHRTVAPLVTGWLGDVALGPAPANKLWIASGNSNRLGYLELPALSAGDVRLDAPVQTIFPLAPSPDGKRRVVIDHRHSGGRITVLDADDPQRATARGVSGFLYVDLLQRRVP